MGGENSVCGIGVQKIIMAMVYKKTWSVRRNFLEVYKEIWVFLSILTKKSFDFKVFLDRLIELEKCSHKAIAKAHAFF